MMPAIYLLGINKYLAVFKPPQNQKNIVFFLIFWNISKYTQGVQINHLQQYHFTDSYWEEMPQKLAMGRLKHNAFLIPTGFTNCTIN
jgi:hypothetical protein